MATEWQQQHRDIVSRNCTMHIKAFAIAVGEIQSNVTLALFE